MGRFLLLTLLVAVSVIWAANRPQVGAAYIVPDGTVHVTNDRPFPVLSMSKVIPVAMALERLPMDRPVTIDTISPGWNPKARKGAQVSVQTLTEWSIIESDNTASDTLVRELGGKPEVARWLRSKGYERNFATEAEMIADVEAMVATPSEFALLLSAIRTPELEALMARTTTGNDRLRSLYPGAPHKSGTLGDYRNDTAIVGECVVVMMSKGLEMRDLGKHLDSEPCSRVIVR